MCVKRLAEKLLEIFVFFSFFQLLHYNDSPRETYVSSSRHFQARIRRHMVRVLMRIYLGLHRKTVNYRPKVFFFFCFTRHLGASQLPPNFSRSSTLATLRNLFGSSFTRSNHRCLGLPTGRFLSGLSTTRLLISPPSARQTRPAHSRPLKIF